MHWPDRYVGLFGQAYYDPSKARWDEDEPFEAQMEGLASVVKAGKVGIADCICKAVRAHALLPSTYSINAT